jgi:predicted dehydrogenase
VTNQSIGAGVVGAGSLGFHHTRILRDLEGVDMVGFYDADPERAAFVASELGVQALPTMEELLDRVQAAVIAVPTTSHELVALAAVQRGVHVMIEKPIAPSLESADRILEAADRAGVLVQTGHVERFNPAILAAEPYLDRPLFIESHRLAPFVSRGTDVAVVLDLMIHDVDLVRSLVGAPIREISATGIPVLTPTVDIANARITFETGAVANLTASRVSMKKERKLRIFQRSGYMSLNLAEGHGEFLRLKGEVPGLTDANLDALTAGGAAQGMPGGIPAGGLLDLVERVQLQGDGVEPLRRELEAFRDAIRGDRPAVVSGRDGRDALAVTLEIEDRIRRHVADSRQA